MQHAQVRQEFEAEPAAGGEVVSRTRWSPLAGLDTLVDMHHRSCLALVCVLLSSCGDRAPASEHKAPREPPRVTDDPREAPAREPSYPNAAGTSPRYDTKDVSATPPAATRVEGPVNVLFTCEDCDYRQLWVGKRPLVLEPHAMVRLKPGKHELSIKTDSKRKQLRSLELAPDRRYEVHLHAGGNWSLEDLGPVHQTTGPHPDTMLDPLPITPTEDSPVDSALVGYWRETKRIPCGGGRPYVPIDPIREFVVWAAGGVGVTWRPFENHHDYHGDYQLDSGQQLVHFTNLQGSYVPRDIDPRGQFVRRGNTLILKDMWLGSSSDALGQPPACGHHFEPSSP